MLKRVTTEEPGKIILYTFIVFILLSLLYTTVRYFVMVNADEIHREEIIITERQITNLEKTVVSDKINRLISDLLYMSDSLRLSQEENWTDEAVEQHWLTFADRKKIYDQIRFIDTDGNELIRINYTSNGASITPEEQLQNKEHRYYFEETIYLQQDQIYISQLDLNIENFEIEQPIKPMLRLSTPYFSPDGQLEGIIVLNYAAEDMLRQVAQAASTSMGAVFMLNSAGYWLYNSEAPEKQWAFMYDDRADESLKTQFPDEWDIIRYAGSGYLHTANGLFSYTNVLSNNEFALDSSEYSMSLGLGDWYIVTYIPPGTESEKLFSDHLSDRVFTVFRENSYVYMLLSFVAFSIAMFLAISKTENERIKYFSEYDTMTGVYNRRAGFEHLLRLYKNSEKDNKICVCFVDINGLKQVNDNLGHDAGDELIISVVNGISNNIRNNDFIARLGGDEFLIIFEGLDEDKTESIWQRIIQEYDEINRTEGRQYVISASHGIEIIQINSAAHVDDVINLADEKMYAEKRIIKKNLQVIRG